MMTIFFWLSRGIAISPFSPPLSKQVTTLFFSSYLYPRSVIVNCSANKYHRLLGCLHFQGTNNKKNIGNYTYLMFFTSIQLTCFCIVGKKTMLTKFSSITFTTILCFVQVSILRLLLFDKKIFSLGKKKKNQEL